MRCATACVGQEAAEVSYAPGGKNYILSRMLPAFFDSILELVVKTSTELPPDVRAAMKAAQLTEAAGTNASQALTIIAQNIDQAVESEGAICQDTGMPTFKVKV